MSFRSTPLVFLFLFTLTLLTIPRSLRAQGAQAVRPSYDPGTVLVAFKPGAQAAARMATVQRLGLTAAPGAQSPHFAVLQLSPKVRAAGLSVPSVVAALQREPTVRYAEPNYRRYPTVAPNDPRFGEQWGLSNIGVVGTPNADIDAVSAWDRTTGSANVIVAVIDTGVDYNHPDLSPNILRDGSGKVIGYDWVPWFDDSDPMDENAASHGTHVAGTIGAVGNNRRGVSGVSWNVKIMPLRCIEDEGKGGTVGDLAGAMDFAVRNKAKIINCSYGHYDFSQTEYEAVLRARNAGVLVVAAAGNDANDNDRRPHYPSNYNAGVISVAASDSNDREAVFSNIGAATVEIAAPGVDILSTVRGGRYDYLSGTSMAAPHVSGAAALLLASEPGLTRQQVHDRILESAEPLSVLEDRVSTGGRLDLFALLGDAYEDDDAWRKAKALEPGKPQYRNIHRKGNNDWAKFTLTEVADVGISTLGPPGGGESVLYLFGSNPDGGYIEQSDPAGWAKIDRRGAKRLAAGTYYVRVDERFNDGILRGYSLTLSVTPLAPDAFENDDTSGAAKLIRPLEVQARSLHQPGDQDWATFTLAFPSDVTVETLPGTGNAPGQTTLYLFGNNPAAGYWAKDEPGGWARLERKGKDRLPPGKYYLLAHEQGNDAAIDAYRLTLRVMPFPVDAFEPDDTWRQAGAISSGQAQERNIHLSGNADWAKFTLDAPSEVLISTSGPGGGKSVLYLFGSKPEAGYLEQSDPGGWARIHRNGRNRLLPGVYYVLVNEQFNDDVLDKYTLTLTVRKLEADLAVTVSPEPANLVSAGSRLTYTVTVKNHGRDLATGVALTQTLPNGGAYYDSAPKVLPVRNQVRWEVGELASGASFTGKLTVTVLQPAGETGVLRSRAEASALESDPVADNNAAEGVTIVRRPQANLLVELLSAEPKRAKVGQPVTYQLVIRNFGPDGATGVVVKETLPANSAFVSAVPTATSAGRVLTWNVGDLAANATFQARVVVTATSPGNLANTVEVTGKEQDNNPENNRVTLTSLVEAGKGPDLTGSWGRIRYVVKRKRGSRRKQHLLTGPYTVRNIGNERSGKASLRFFVSMDQTLDKSDSLVSTASVPALAPGATWKIRAGRRKALPTFTMKSKKGTAGGTLHKGGYLFLVIDQPDRVREQNELNNEALSAALP